MKKFLILLTAIVLAFTLVTAAACKTVQVTTDDLLAAMSTAGTPAHVSIVVSNGTDEAGDYTVIYSYNDGEVYDPFELDDGTFALAADTAQEGYTFAFEDFSEYDNSLDQTNNCYVVVGTLADPAAFLGVDATTATVEALIGAGDVLLDSLTIEYVAASGNEVSITVTME